MSYFGHIVPTKSCLVKFQPLKEQIGQNTVQTELKRQSFHQNIGDVTCFALRDANASSICLENSKEAGRKSAKTIFDLPSLKMNSLQ